MSEQELLEDVCRLMDEGIVIDRSEKPIRPVATVVASVRNKERADDASRFVAELQRKYPLARLVVGGKSPVEKAAVEMAELIDMPYEIVEPGAKGDWDAGSTVHNERIVSRASHVICFDTSSRSEEYKKLAARTGKFVQTVE